MAGMAGVRGRSMPGVRGRSIPGVRGRSIPGVRGCCWIPDERGVGGKGNGPLEVRGVSSPFTTRERRAAVGVRGV